VWRTPRGACGAYRQWVHVEHAGNDNNKYDDEAKQCQQRQRVEKLQI
jgi:hypothetical protein